MGFFELVSEFLRNIDFEKSEIMQPQKLVFVCGGKASNKADEPWSMRELLLQKAAQTVGSGKLGDATILLAEEAIKALEKSSFSNLLDLEEYIAAIVHAVLLIVESPGSMCELGAFVKTQEIREKLIVIMPSDYKNVPSFITSGAVKFLEENYPPAQVLGFHWNVDKNGVISAPDYTLDEMDIAIPEAMRQVHKVHEKESFRKNKIGHLIYLCLAFCHLLRSAKLADIKECFSVSGIVIDETAVKRCIDTLVICKLLKAVENGKLTYYVSRVGRMPLEIRWRSGTPNPDRNTLRRIARIAAEIEREEKFRIEMFRGHGNV